MKHITDTAIIREQHNNLLTDESHYIGGLPSEIFFPESEDDIISIVNLAAPTNRTITISGARTGITAGAIPVDDTIVLSFSAMKKIRAVTIDSSGNKLLECEPGVTLSEIDTFLQDPPHWPYHVDGTELLAESRYCYPPDPTEMSAALGGTLATNASGARSFRFGSTRNHIHALTIILPSGQKASITRGEIRSLHHELTFPLCDGTTKCITLPDYKSPTIKNAAGYYRQPDMDLIDLLIGSEGTLAIFSSITIRLTKKPSILSGLSFFPNRQAAFDCADFLRTESQVAAIEYFDPSALAFLNEYKDHLSIELPSFPEKMTAAIYWEYSETTDNLFENCMEQWETEFIRHGSSFDSTWSGFDAAGLRKLKTFRHLLPELVNSTVARNQSTCAAIRKISTDAAVHKEEFMAVFKKQLSALEQQTSPFVIFGHLGDYHLHINLLPRNAEELESALSTYRIIMEIAIQHHGTISAEHGIGKLKKEYLQMMCGEDTMSAMRSIKKEFDPEGMLNPGNLF